jgi:hypothetical protein
MKTDRFLMFFLFKMELLRINEINPEFTSTDFTNENRQVFNVFLI